jgi:phenylacetate-CoA ligase
MRQLVLYIYKRLLNNGESYHYYKLFEKSQFWSRERLIEYQIELFKKLWLHSKNNVPYYKDIANSSNMNGTITLLDDIRKLPILTKDIIRNNSNKLIAQNIHRKRFKNNSTSGSTGSNLYFYSDNNKTPIDQALEMRRYNWMNVNKYDRELVIWGANFDVNKSKDRKYAKYKDWFKKIKLISGYNLSDYDLMNIYHTMKSFKPLIIKSYPSILMTISDYFQKHNLYYRPEVIHIGGEKLYEFQKKQIEYTFNSPVYDYYGARDMSQIAQQCNMSDGLHVFMENVLVEIVNQEGNPIEEGEGDLIITDLHNYVMPFIRYKIGDRARISKDRKCKCGRNLQLIDEVVGRTFEIIKFPNGNRVGGTFWTLLMKTVPGIIDFQVVQERYDEILINYTSVGNYMNFNNIIKNIHEYSGDKLRVIFKKVNKIPITECGKMQFIISKIK